MKKYESVKLVGVPLDAVGVEADFGRLELRHRLKHGGGGIAVSSLKQEIYAWFGFNRSLLLAEALDYASDLQDLVSIATQRPAAFGVLRFYDSSWDHAASDPQKRLRAELYGEWRVKTQTYKRDPRSSDMLFTFEQLGGIEGVKRWMTAAEKYRELLGRVMVTRYSQEPVVQDIVLNRVAPLEAFHRLWSGVGENKMNLADRLDALIAYAGEPFEKLIGAGNASKWRQKAKSHRHDIAHHLGRHTGLDAAELFYIGQGAYWLFVICMLREARAPREVFDHMTTCQRFLWEAKEIQGIL